MNAVHGLNIDDRPGCAHWRTARDIVAIKFACCGLFYACFECHAACADHASAVWPRADWDAEQAILCRACQRTMTIAAYRDSDSRCPHCAAAFNPSCRNHWHLYFAA